MAQRDLATAGYLLFAEMAGGVSVTFALGQLGFDAKDTMFLVVCAMNLVTAVFLARACSHTCVLKLPRSPEGYFQGPHKGGTEVRQPQPK